MSINIKLTSFDCRLTLVEILYKDFKCCVNIWLLAVENSIVRESVKRLTDGMMKLSEGNECMHESILDRHVVLWTTSYSPKFR